MTNYSNWIAGKTFCVTGAGGSIGAEICRELVRYGAHQLRMIGHSELPLYNIDGELHVMQKSLNPTQIIPILGSVTDEALMMKVFEGADVVIHAAAHKHVPLCEQNPLEAIANNVGGFISVAQAAHRRNVKQVVLISSDKAVNPASIMGATKRACELYVKFQQARSATKFTTVRFGNVLDSAGSVLPLWREQIRRDGRITITDKRCTRFFMSIPEAVQLTLSAAAFRRPDGLFVLDMGEPKYIIDMARAVIENWLQERDNPFGTSEFADDFIEVVGLRPGEKLTEELTYGGERVATAERRVWQVKEDTSRVPLWKDFPSLMQATRAGAKDVALKQLWEIVR